MVRLFLTMNTLPLPWNKYKIIVGVLGKNTNRRYRQVSPIRSLSMSLSTS